jgi:hypothetical protein
MPDVKSYDLQHKNPMTQGGLEAHMAIFEPKRRAAGGYATDFM